jgi:hypothetical protein
MKNLQELNLALNEAANTEDELRQAECNNIKSILWNIEWIEAEEVDEIIKDLAVRIQELIANPKSRGKHNLTK